MADKYGDAAAATVAKDPRTWRRRFSKRFNIGVRRKTNVKNKTWEESEPVLLRYLAGLRKRLQLVAPIELEGGGGGEEGEEPEPPDEDPGWEPDPKDPDAPPLPELDSEDEPDEDDELVTLTDAVSAGMQVAAPPETELLEYKSAAGAALVGRSLIFNWVGIGWCAGTIESAEKDGRRKSKVRVA